MSFIVTIVHVCVSLFLMLTVLLQAGKGGGMGATFGGGSSQGSVFGGSGAGNFLSKLTTFSAAFFMLTSMTLAFLASSGGEDSLQKFSAQQRGHAAEKRKKDSEASELNKATQPDASLTDEGNLEGLDLDSLDLDGLEGDEDEVDLEGGDEVDGSEGDELDELPEIDDADEEPEAAVAPKPAPAAKPVVKEPAIKKPLPTPDTSDEGVKPTAVTPKPAPAVTPKPAPAVTPKPAPAVTPKPAPAVTPAPAGGEE